MRRSAAAIGLLASPPLPGTLLAADTTIQSQSNSTVVFVVVALLLGSVAAGLFFSSPLPDRVLRSPKLRARDVTARADTVQAETPAQPLISPSALSQAPPMAPNPLALATPYAGTWSTGTPQPTATWRSPETTTPES